MRGQIRAEEREIEMLPPPARAPLVRTAVPPNTKFNGVGGLRTYLSLASGFQ